MKFSELVNEVFDLKSVNDQIDQMSTNLGSLKKQVVAGLGEVQRENEKLKQDNATLSKQMADAQKSQMQNRSGTGTVAKIGGGPAKTTQSTTQATGAPSAPTAY